MDKIDWIILFVAIVFASFAASSVSYAHTQPQHMQICFAKKTASSKPHRRTIKVAAKTKQIATKSAPPTVTKSQQLRLRIASRLKNHQASQKPMGNAIKTSLNDTLGSTDKESLMAIPTTLDDQPTNAGTLQESLPEYVVIVPSEEATFSSETAASVAKLYVKEGSTFKKGDMLVKLDCRVQDAELKKAKALQKEANMAYKSAQKLKGYGTISEFELVQAVTQRDLADAEVDKLNSIVSKCAIYAPFNGAVSKVSVNLHESVKPGDPLIKIVSTENLDFIVQIPSDWLKWLHVGSKFKVTVNEIGKVVDVKVAKITPVINSVSQTVKIIGEEVGKNHDANLLPGMSGRASFPGKPINMLNSSNKK